MHSIKFKGCLQNKIVTSVTQILSNDASIGRFEMWRLSYLNKSDIQIFNCLKYICTGNGHKRKTQNVQLPPKKKTEKNETGETSFCNVLCDAA